MKSGDALLLLGGLGALVWLAQSDTPTNENLAPHTHLMAGRRYLWTIETSEPGNWSGVEQGLNYEGADLRRHGAEGAVAVFSANVGQPKSVPVNTWWRFADGHSERTIRIEDIGPATE